MNSRGIIVGIIFISFLTCVSAQAQVFSEGSDESPGELDKKIEETANEVTKAVIENVKRFLDEKLTEIRNESIQSRIPVKKRARELASRIQQNPRDASAYYDLGILYDAMKDGANAIIHVQKAERLFTAQNDVKGVAESRRLLRQYFTKYGFKAEDFEIEKRGGRGIN